MAEIGMTEVTAASSAAIATLIQETLRQKAKLLPTVSDYSSWAGKGVKSVSVPRASKFSAADKAENSALTSQELTLSVDTISLNKHKAVYTALEKIANMQSAPDMVAKIVDDMSAELALQLDKDIITELKDVSSSGPDHLLDYADSSGDSLARVEFSNARKLLRKQNVNMEDGNLYCLTSPEQEENLLNISAFVEADKYGSRESILSGEIGRVFGFKIIIHSEMAATDAVFYHKSHVGGAIGQAEFKRDESLSKVADEFLLHQVYGAETLQGKVAGVYFNGSGS